MAAGLRELSKRGLRHLSEGERAVVGRFAEQHGEVLGFAASIADDAGNVSSPLIRLPLLARLEARGTISAAEAAAGERFGWLFRLAQLDPLKAADMARPASVAGYRDAAVSASGEHARRQVSDAMRALGGAGSVAASAIWSICGLEMSTSRWATTARRDRGQACGILCAGLGVLVGHFGERRQRRA